MVMCGISFFVNMPLLLKKPLAELVSGLAVFEHFDINMCFRKHGYILV